VPDPARDTAFLVPPAFFAAAFTAAVRTFDPVPRATPPGYPVPGPDRTNVR
jgi:hypothetical protein